MQSKDLRYRDADFLREKYVKEGLTLAEIGELCDCDPTSVRKWLQEHDIETRSPGGVNRVPYARYGMNAAGYMQWQAFNADDRTQDHFYVHRLLAIAEYGFDVVADRDIHHINGVRWDNRPSNIELIDHREHATLHGKRRGKFSYLDKLRIAELYRGGDVTQEELGEVFGASQTYISKIILEVVNR